MSEQTEDEPTTMQREWMDMQRRRLELDAERDRVWLEHMNRQTAAMEMQTEALVGMARALHVLLNVVVTKNGV